MKFLVLLALLTSCGSMTKEKVDGPKESAGESDAKPVSPYTVQPCYCMKIFRPVCADGQNFGNSCEAECHGHKTWNEGQCAKPQQ
jgi:hypothetical protein